MWVSQTWCPNEMFPIFQRQNYLPRVAGILFRNYLMRLVKEQMDPNLNSSKQNLPFQLKLHTFSFLIIPNLLITTLTTMKPQTIITKHFCLFQVHTCYMSGIIICIPWLWCYTFIFYMTLEQCISARGAQANVRILRVLLSTKDDRFIKCITII